MSRIWSVILAMINPPPSSPSEIAVVRIIAMVMVILRRNPFRTSVTTNPARMCSSRVPAAAAAVPNLSTPAPCGWTERRTPVLATDSVHATRLIPDDLAELQFDDPAPHRVDDRVVVGR